MPRPGHRTRSCSLLAAFGLAMARLPAAHAECGLAAPDYAAERIVDVSGNVSRMRVHVSGGKMREETDLGQGVRVTIRDPEQGRVVVFDPATAQGTALPAPHGGRLPSRHQDEATPEGGRTRTLQVERAGRWLDLSRTTCRMDGIMVRQSFVSLDPAGREISGTVMQTQIQVAPQLPSLFELPSGLRLSSP